MEDFDESEHVPRILPCSHTLCQGCLKQMIRDKSVKCPECRVQHAAGNKEKSFPQNKYLLGLIDMKRKPKILDVCDKHGRELTLFSQQTGCLKPVCPTCLSKDHQKHDVVGIEEERKNTLFTKIKKLFKDLQGKIKKISDARNELKKNNEVCVSKLKAEQEKYVKKINIIYENLIKHAMDETKKIDKNMAKEVASIDENFAALTKIEENGKKDTVTLENVNSYLETISKMTENLKRNMSGTKLCRYPEYKESQIQEQV